MGRIKIKDLPKEMKISRQDLRWIRGGVAFPDVCKTPSPGGSAPIPYSDIATKSSKTAKDANSVKVSGEMGSGEMGSVEKISGLTYNLADFSAYIMPALDD